MRILVLAPQPFFVPRGTPIAVRALLQVLTSEGHECDALVFAEGSDPAIEGCRVFRVPAFPGTRNMPPGFSLKKVVADIGLTWMAAGRMRRNAYDLVIAVEEAAFIACMAEGMPQKLKEYFRIPEA